MSDPDPLVAAVGDFVEASYALKAAALKAAAAEVDMPLEHWLLTMLDIREGTDAAKEARDAMGEVAYDLMPSPQIRVAGVGQFSKVHGWRRKWKVDEALDWLLEVSRIRRLSRRDPETGEVEAADAALLALVRKVCGIGYLRITAISELGGDADEFVAEKTRIRHGVSLPSPPAG